MTTEAHLLAGLDGARRAGWAQVYELRDRVAWLEDELAACERIARDLTVESGALHHRLHDAHGALVSIRDGVTDDPARLARLVLAQKWPKPWWWGEGVCPG